MPPKHFECPFCEAPVPAELDQLHDPAAVLVCSGCGRHVYLTAGKLSNFQPGGRPGEPPTAAPGSYDSGD